MALSRAAERDPQRFRILHFSVQWDHIHLIVEASDQRALSCGVRSIAIRIALYVNGLLGRRGPLWADRWHGHELESPREVRNALLYVLANFRKHAKVPLPEGVDAFSSALFFDGWRGFAGTEPLPRAGPPFHRAMAAHVFISRSRTWLGSTGWRHRGLIGVGDAPQMLEGALD